jgi:hypothetical protein
MRPIYKAFTDMGRIRRLQTWGDKISKIIKLLTLKNRDLPSW